MLVADSMTLNGEVKGITRVGIISEKSSVLARASFETPIKQFVNASVRGAKDELRSAIENVILNHLRIEDEIIGIQEERDGYQQLATVCAKAAVAIGKTRAEHQIFQSCESAIRCVLPDGHAALERAAVENPGPYDHFGLSVQYGLNKLGHQSRIILVIGM
jgi:hypothetical protein